MVKEIVETSKKELANSLRGDELSLDEKLALIDKVMNDPEYQAQVNKQLGRPMGTPVDPQDALNCESCQ